MNIHAEAKKRHEQITAWRKEIHMHPETAYQEFRTSDLVAENLEKAGLDLHRGMAETGIIATLQRGEGPAIALRADMDALHIHEANTFAHRSRIDGKMHACGHDGHTAMLLGAALILAESDTFRGTVHFIFQPAEENEGGGRRMVEEGLFDKFPVESVYGLHNWPGMPVAMMGFRKGAIMAAYDRFEIRIKGQGCHAAMPQNGNDVILSGSELISNLQKIVSRSNPLDPLVVSVTQVHAGETFNVIPDSIYIAGTVRSFQPDTSRMAEARLRKILEGLAHAEGIAFELNYQRLYPATINSARETELCYSLATELFGADRVVSEVEPSLGSEDFGCMLEVKPGCYAWLGNGPTEGGCLLHNPAYDFNDAAIPAGVSYWIALTEKLLQK